METSVHLVSIIHTLCRHTAFTQHNITSINIQNINIQIFFNMLQSDLIESITAGLSSDTIITFVGRITFQCKNTLQNRLVKPARWHRNDDNLF